MPTRKSATAPQPSPLAASLAAQFADDPAVTPGRSAGSLTVGGKVFAMVVKDKLVVKLPAERGDALLAAGRVRRYEMGKRVMREWFVVSDSRAAKKLAAEARAALD
jgi:hypothetical protein